MGAGPQHCETHGYAWAHGYTWAHAERLGVYMGIGDMEGMYIVVAMVGVGGGKLVIGVA